MKLPHHLLRTYRRYKEDEKDLLCWIESTAIKSGYKFSGNARSTNCNEISTDHSVDTRQPNRSTNIDRHSRSMKEEPTITILEILPLVRVIARCPKIATVPTKIAGVFTRVLNLRSDCVKWFRQNTHQNDIITREKNREHTHPLDVLRLAIQMLGPKLPPTSAPVSLSSAPPTTTSAPAPLKHKKTLSSLGDETTEQLPPTPHLESKHYNDPSLRPLAQSLDMDPHQKLQEEYIVLKFCLVADLKEIEDFMFLEIVRYTLDQANADTLPLLFNAAIDIVAKMDMLICNDFDREKLEHGFWNTVLRSDANVMLHSPLLRMEDLIRQLMQKSKGNSTLKGFQWCREVFDPTSEYFGMTNWDQAEVERKFIKNILRMKVMSASNGDAPIDRTLSLISELFHQPDCGDSVVVVPLAVVFGIRLSLLTALLLRDQPDLPLKSLLGIGSNLRESVSSQNDLWHSPRYQSQRVEDIWRYVQPEQIKARASFLARPPSIRISKDALPTHLTFAWAECLLRMDYAIRSVQVMETSNIVKVLAHLWNILQEEKHLNSAWPDMEYLRKALGENYLFQDSRPIISRGGSTALRSRLRYGMGFTLEGTTSSSRSTGNSKPQAVFRAIYTQSSAPFYTLLKIREEGIVGSTCRVEDLDLLVHAVVVPSIIGTPARFIRLNFRGQIEDRHEAWKLLNAGPRLQPLELLALVKKGLSQDFRVLDFDYLTFELATLELSESISDEMNGTNVPNFVRDAPDVYEKLQFAARGLVYASNQAPQWSKLASIMGRWLSRYGHVGVKALKVAEQLPVNPKSLISSLRPEVLEVVKEIVKVRGLRDDVFLEPQLDVGSIRVTNSIETTIMDKWAKHKTKKKKN